MKRLEKITPRSCDTVMESTQLFNEDISGAFPLFDAIDKDILKSCLAAAQPVTCKKDELIIDHGAEPVNLYLVLSGGVSLYLLHNGKDVLLDTVARGGYFGDIGLFNKKAPRLKAVANDDVTIITLPREKVDELLAASPAFGNAFYRNILRRQSGLYSKRDELSHRLLKQHTIQNDVILGRKEDELLFLNRIHKIIVSDNPFKKKLSQLSKGIADFYEIDLCLLYLYEKDNKYVKLYATNDYKNVYASSYRLNQDDAVVRWIKEKRSSLLIDYDQPSGGKGNSAGRDNHEFARSKFLSAPMYRHLLFIPLIENSEVVGLLAILNKEKIDYFAQQKSFLGIVTDSFISIIRKEQFDYEANLRTVELGTLKKIGDAVHTKDSLKELLQFILESTANATNAKRCTLTLQVPLSDTMKMRSSYGFDDAAYKTVRRGIERHLRESVIEIGEFAIINDVSQIPRFSDEAKSMVTSLISAPFQLHNKVIGMITVYDKKDDALIDTFDQNDLRLLTAVATHTSIIVENARLYDELAYSQSGAKVQLKVDTKIVGESMKAKIVNDKIKAFSLNDAPALIIGEVGIGKNFVARCIHFSSTRMANHFIIEDCRHFQDKRYGVDLFGQAAIPGEQEERRGLLQLANDGTLTLRHVEALSKGVQQRLYDYLITKNYRRKDGAKELSSDVKIIFQTNIDLRKLVESDLFNADLYALMSKQTIRMPPLSERKKDLPLIIRYFLGIINLKLQKNVTNLSDNALGMLMSYDWPGNLMELYNVLERGVLVTSQDTILSEQIFLGIPRAEGEKTYNLLRVKWISDILKSRLYPAIPQAISVIVFFAIIYFSFFSQKEGEQNIAVILSWIIGWPLIFISFIFFGRVWCAVCPFSSIAKLLQKFVNFGYTMPDKLKKNGNVIAVIFALVIIWFEEMTNIFMSPVITGGLVLFIFTLALMTSILYKRMVWCRYLCPWGIFNGIYAMASVIELRSNKHICLTQCKTNVCYEGGENAPGCPMFEHPYGIESNKNCTHCGNCIKNCPNNSIQFNLRILPKELWVKAHPYFSDSILGISLAFLLILKKILEIQSVSEAVFLGYDRYSVHGALIYTALFIMTIILSTGALMLINTASYDIEEKSVRNVRHTVGYSFIPLALCGFLSHYLEPLFMKGSAIFYAISELLFKAPFPDTLQPILEHSLISNIQIALILFGGFASGFSAYRLINTKLKPTAPKVAAYKIVPIWLIAVITFIYLLLI